MKEVRILAKDPDIDITVPMGDGPATISSGLGGWQAVERVDDVAMSDWSGQEPLTQDIPLMLDGWAKNESVERELNTIFKLGRDPNGSENVPPVFKVFGPVHFPGKSWVLPQGGIELGDGVIRRKGDGELLRQPLILHLLEYVKPDTIRVRKRGRKRMGIGQNRPLSYTTRQGDTLASIAARVLGDWKRWKEIGGINGLSDPNRILPAGRELRL